MALRRFLAWAKRDRRLFFEALTLAVWAEVVLRIVRFSSVLARLTDRAAAEDRRSPPSVAELQRIIRAVYTIFPFRPTCLKESLIVCRMLQRRGSSVRLRIGVRRVRNQIESHAWVEDDRGAALTDAQEYFAPLPL